MIPEPRTNLAFSDDEWEAVKDAIDDRIDRLSEIQQDRAYDSEDQERAAIAQTTLEDLLIRWYHEVR